MRLTVWTAICQHAVPTGRAEDDLGLTGVGVANGPEGRRLGDGSNAGAATSVSFTLSALLGTTSTTYKTPMDMATKTPNRSFLLSDRRLMIHHGIAASTMSMTPDHAVRCQPRV